MSIVGFPLLLIPAAIYNIIAFLMPDVNLTQQATPLFKLNLMSGTQWPVTLSDVLLTLGVLMLMCEVIKGARPGAKYLTDHLLSLIVFGAAAAEFVMWSRFGTSTYFLLTVLALADFLSGVALRTRRGVAVAPATTMSRKSARKAAASQAEPEFEPAPAPVTATPAPPSFPAAASVAESVLMDHPGPTLAQPVIVAGAPPSEIKPPDVTPPEVTHAEAPPVETPAPAVVAPEISSPDLQPGHDLPPGKSSSPDAPR